MWYVFVWYAAIFIKNCCLIQGERFQLVSIGFLPSYTLQGSSQMNGFDASEAMFLTYDP